MQEWSESVIRRRSLLTAGGMAMVGLVMGTSKAHAGTGNNYPEPWRSAPLGAYVDSWRYFSRYCTSWCAWALHDRNGFEMPHAIGDASNWGPWAKSHGYAVDMTPAKGAVAWWSSNHVAWVESVSGDQVVIEEYNYGYTGNYNRRTINKASVSGYIHFKDMGVTPSVPTYMDGGGFHPTPTGSGYMMVLKQGNVYTQGDAQYHGGLPSSVNETIVDAALRPDSKGYWLLAKGGNIYSYGAAPYYGGTPASAGATFAALVRTPSGNGYLMVSMTGNVYAYGDARYFGGIPTSVGEKVVDIATAPDGGGYWILTRTGNVYAYGNAGYHGGAPSGLRPFVAILPSQTGKGYALVMDTGQVYTYGDGRYFGGGPAGYGGGGITAAASTPDGGGYWLMSFAGNVYTYGNARYYGGAPSGLSGF